MNKQQKLKIHTWRKLLASSICFELSDCLSTSLSVFLASAACTCSSNNLLRSNFESRSWQQPSEAVEVDAWFVTREPLGKGMSVRFDQCECVDPVRSLD